jgi:hypothetical protein
MLFKKTHVLGQALFNLSVTRNVLCFHQLVPGGGAALPRMAMGKDTSALN